MRKIAIIKNGFDILRIIEGNCDGDKCDFKIVPMVDIECIRIFCMRIFSDAEEVIFDRNRKFELSYHKATISKPTKIHIKSISKDDPNDIIYKTLPLDNLIDPNIHTEFPIPLLKITLSDSVLTKKYKTDIKNHKVFDIGDSNILEIFMTKSHFMDTNFYEKWGVIRHTMILNSIEFYASQSTRYMGYNYWLVEYGRKHFEQEVNMSSDINDDIGLTINRINTLNNSVISEGKMDFLFIENSLYLAFLAFQRIKKENMIEPQYAYKLCLNNNLMFSKDEINKWNYRFGREEDKLKTYIKSHYEEYKRIK